MKDWGLDRLPKRRDRGYGGNWKEGTCVLLCLRGDSSMIDFLFLVFTSFFN